MTTKQITEPLYKESELENGKMYVRIKDIAYIYADKNRDFFKDAAGLYMEVETAFLFHNQYNTKQLRVYDSMIDRVINDVRANWCKNKYTGAMVKVGQEAEYLATQEAKVNKCTGCFWNTKKLLNSTKETEGLTETIKNEYGTECTYKGDTACTYSEAAKYGFEYFTEKNTYFLKYPNGVTDTPIKSNRIEDKKIGTYTLEYYDSLGYYRLSNCRQTINFKFDGKKYYINNGIGYKEATRLNVPESVNKKLAKLL